MREATNAARQIIRHTPADFEGMRKAGALAADILDRITEHVVPGLTTGPGRFVPCLDLEARHAGAARLQGFEVHLHVHQPCGLCAWRPEAVGW